jgi:hypothetical protein
MMEKKLAKKKVGPQVVTLSIILMAVGFVFMIQPFSMVLYSISFTILLLGVILINVGSHL